MYFIFFSHSYWNEHNCIAHLEEHYICVVARLFFCDNVNTIKVIGFKTFDYFSVLVKNLLKKKKIIG